MVFHPSSGLATARRGQREDRANKTLLREIQQHGSTRSADPLGLSALADEMQEILFFDSHYELERSNLLSGLVAIRKRGEAGLSIE